MPPAGGGNTRAKQRKRVVTGGGPQGTGRITTPKPRVVKGPSKRQINQAKVQARSYKSQGVAVEKDATRKVKARKVRQHEVKDTKGTADRGRGKAESQKNVSEARLKYLRRTRQPVTTLKKELEGKGLLAKGLKKVGESAGYTSTGGGPNVAAAVGRKATTGDFKPRGSAAITIPQLVSAKKAKGAGRLAQDLVNFPAQALPSVYVPVAAAVEKLQGRPQRANQFKKDISQHDPVYNAGKALVQAATGDSHGASKSLKRAGKAAAEHPGFAALEVAGVKGTVGRGAGRVARSGVAGKAVKKVASTDRAPRVEPGTNLSDRRSYSPDVTAKAVQVAKEKVQAGRAKRLRTKAETAKPADAHALQRKANRVDPTRMKPSDVRRRVDERVAANEDVRRINRAEVTRAVDEAVKPHATRKPKVDQAAVDRKRRVEAKLRADEWGIKNQMDSPVGRGHELIVRHGNVRAALKATHPDHGGSGADFRTVQAAREAGATSGPSLTKELTRVQRERASSEATADPVLPRSRTVQKLDSVRNVVRPGRKGGAALSLVAQNITKASKADLKAYREEIATHFDELDNAGKRANKQLRRQIGKVLKDPKVDLAEVQAAADRYQAIVAPLQKKLTDRGLLAEGQADKAKLIPYAVRHMGARHDPEKGIFVTRQVKRAGEAAKTEDVVLKPAVIRAHMAKHGVKEPAFITQAPNSRGAKNYYVASDRAPVVRKQARTGEATRKGTFDAHPETLREGAAKAQGLADATDGFAGFVKEVGHHDAKGLRTFKNRDDAQKAADNMQADAGGNPTGATKFRPIRLNPWGANKEQLTRLLDEVNADSPTAAKAVADTISSAVEKNATGDGPWALVPDAAADQLAKHMKVIGPGALGKSAELINSSFRKTVLSTSPKWLLGNVTEAAGRSALAKAGPRSYLTGRKVMRRLKELDPEAAKEASARTAGGGHYSMAQRTPRRDHTQFEDTNLEGLAKNLGAFWQAPGPKQAAGLWHGWTDLVFNKVNKPIESQFQTAMLGKAVRDSHLMDGNLRKLSKKAIDQAAQGLKDTNEQVAFGRAVDRMYGKYNKFSPGKRQAIALYTPFVAWSLNALRFVYDVLPRDHPTVTGLIAASEIATDEWRKSHGLDLFMQKAAPGFIQGSIPVKGGGHQQVSKYLPFGAFGAPTETAAGAVLPQLSGVLAALKNGEDWKGSRLMWQGKPVGGDPLKRSAYAAQVFAEATVPAIGLAKRLIQQGPSTLNPVKPIGPKKARVRKSSGVTWDDHGSGIKWNDGGSSVKWDG